METSHTKTPECLTISGTNAMDVQQLRSALDRLNAEIFNLEQKRMSSLVVKTDLGFFKRRSVSPSLDPKRMEDRYMRRLRREVNPCGSPIQTLPQSPAKIKTSPIKRKNNAPLLSNEPRQAQIDNPKETKPKNTQNMKMRFLSSGLSTNGVARLPKSPSTLQTGTKSNMLYSPIGPSRSTRSNFP